MITQRAPRPDTAPSYDLVERLIRARRPSRVGTAFVGVVGGTRQGRVALAEALQPPGTDSTEVVFLDDTLRDVDAVLFTADGGSPLTGPELDLMRAVATDGLPLLLALTGIDRHRQWHDVLTADLASLRDLGVGVEPFAVSTRLHSAAIASDDSELAIASGVPALVTRLHDLAGREDKDRSAHESVGSVTPLEAAQDALQRSNVLPGSQEDKPRKPGRRPSPPGPSWQQVLGDGFAAASSDVDFDLRVRMRAVAAEAERAIDDGHVDRAWADFDSRLRDRLVYEAQQTCTLLTARVEAVAATLRAHLDAATPNPVVLPLPTRDHLFEHVQPHRPTAGGRPLATRGQALLRSAYGGILMAFVIPRLAGLKVPIWVLAAGASITAIALVVATVLGERKRRLDRLRSQARRTVRHCTDGFLLSAGKHTRDALRSAQQQLRDDCAARAGQPRPGQPRPKSAGPVPPRPWRPPGANTTRTEEWT